MSILSDESMLIARNWDIVEDIINAKKRLGKELASILVSIESELTKNSWWRDGWVFNPYYESQVYVSNQQWQINDTLAIWIGVEGFSPKHIFGIESPPNLYVWVAKRRYDLAQMLAEQIERSDHEILGEIDHRTSGYVVKASVKKCLPEEVEEFGEAASKQIVDFFAHYAQILWDFNPMIQDYLANLKTEGSKDDS